MNPWAVFNVPDGAGWVVHGAKIGGRCYVVASTKVTTSEMQQTVGRDEFFDGDWMAKGWRNARVVMRFGGDMGLGEGDTFQAAMADLFARWDPEKGQVELPPAKHRCGEPATEHAESKCINCGCWGDTHPAVSFGYDCVCTDFALPATTPTERRIDALEREAGVGPYAE